MNATVTQVILHTILTSMNIQVRIYQGVISRAHYITLARHMINYSTSIR